MDNIIHWPEPSTLSETNALHFADIEKVQKFAEKCVKSLGRVHHEKEVFTFVFDDCNANNEQYVNQFCKYIQECFRTKPLNMLCPYILVRHKIKGIFLFPSDHYTVEVSTMKIPS